jgi:E3 ubiquitin-protein ligase UBR3
MSLCADCFEGGNHEGHDFNMFRSGAGGACDCGDTNVMNKTGICESHCNYSKKIEVPQELWNPSSGIIVKVTFQKKIS